MVASQGQPISSRQVTAGESHQRRLRQALPETRRLAQRMLESSAAAIMRRQPFVPFRVSLSDQSNYTIKHPELAYLVQTDLAIYNTVGNKLGPEQQIVSFVSLLHITRVEFLASTSPPQTRRGTPPMVTE